MSSAKPEEGWKIKPVVPVLKKQATYREKAVS